MKILLIIVSMFFCLSLHASEVHLKWDANSEPNLAGYKIHYGLLGVCGSANEGNNFTEIVDVGNVIEYTISDLDKGTYNFAITAYDLDGNESEFSYIVIISLNVAKVKGLTITKRE